MTADTSAMLETAIRAARAAGHELMQRLGGTVDVRWKTYQGERTVVTDADMAADAAIREVLQAQFPGHVILSEEAPTTTPWGPMSGSSIRSTAPTTIRAVSRSFASAWRTRRMAASTSA